MCAACPDSYVVALRRDGRLTNFCAHRPGSPQRFTLRHFGMETTTPPSLLGELESAIQNGSSERRIDMLRRIADLFVDTAPRITEKQADVFDDVFEHLIKEIESRAMLELSDRMASVENAPE